ncbi:OPT/YSL family transporter [Staphylothermus hellenicus]|uniref:Oligopeptide transporter OPT superfamily protein n=1 Tax=Staphylothermus hellenicus (strain DSM 12710 / JCM 10830 / BK20S6-10-b1 / P8) TaxID=591019 RepID=D7D8Q5_STAHD|nr:OPT/YSL family transporter [Staphylothermus hellenicus]ADI32151.1 Oligopeptide transporter OPT superfamily protein [Staphylothermus hellenicus DSM 12710]
MAESTSNGGSAVTWRVVLAILYGALVFEPAAIWLNLVAGLNPWQIINSAEYTTLLLFTTIAAIMGARLTRQEAFVMFSNVGTTISESLFGVNLILAWYIAISEYARSFGLYGKIPFWYAPTIPELPRTLFQAVFIPPLLVAIASALLTKGMDLSLAYVLYKIYAVEEKLPFPGARIWAESSIVLAEKHIWRDKARVMISVAVFSLLYTFLLYGVWFMFGVQLLPVPWADLTSSLESIGLNGASLGFSLDLLLISIGMIMPWKVNVSIFIGGIFAYLIGAPMAVKYGLFTLWRPGMNLGDIFQYGLLQLYVGPLIGLSFAAGLAPMVINWRSVVRVFRPPKIRGREASTVSEPTIWGLPLTRFALLIYLLSATGLSLFVYYLVYIVEPQYATIQFLLIFLALIVGFSTLFQLANTRALGEAATGINLPYVKEGALLASGYRGVAAWFTPIYVYGGASGWTAVYVACDWTNTKKSDYLKAYFIAFPLTYLMGLIYADIFWRIAPIPSSAYPASAVFWRVSALWALLWPAWASGALKTGESSVASALLSHFSNWPTRIMVPFIVGAVIVALVKIFSIPFELIGFTIGISQPISYTMTMFIGGIIARILEKKKGSEWFKEYVAVISAGLGLGEGLMIAISVAVALIMKSLWLLVY